MKNETRTEMLYRICNREDGRTPEVMQPALDGRSQQMWKDGEWVGVKRVYMADEARRR
jgi:hypothetical protein